MNKIYKVVWSKVKNCYVVASELAKSYTKAPKSGVISRTVIAGVLSCVISFGVVVFDVYAASTNTIGEVIAFSKDSNPAGYLLCDGRAVSRTQYAKLFAEIGTKYGAGDGSTTFNLPNLVNRFVEGSTSAGSYIQAGLPNITGSFSGGDIEAIWDLGNSTGAFSVIKENTSNVRDGSESDLNTVGVTFDASKSNSIYGKSTTVQPNALTMRYFIKVSDDTNIDENLHVKGTTQLDKATTIGTSSANANLTVNGNETVSGTITSTGKITSKAGVAAGGKVTGVTAGTADTDALNVKQLKDEVKLANDGNYVKAANTTAANLTALDTQAKSSADDIAALDNDKAEKDASNVAGYAQQWADAVGTGTVTADDTKMVTGKTVYDALHDTNMEIVVKSVTANTVNGDDVNVTNDLTVLGDTHLHDTYVDGILDVTKNATFHADVSIEKNLRVDGDGSFGGDLTVEGDTHLEGDLNVDGKSVFYDDVTMKKNLDVDGNATVGSLEVEGNGKVNGNLQVLGDQSVEGNSIINGNQTIKKDTDMQGNAHVGKDLLVDGNASVGKDLHVIGESKLDGNVTMGSDASVIGDFSVVGDTTLHDTLIDGTLEVNKEATFHDNVTMDKDLAVAGNASISKDLMVEGISTLKGDVTAESNMIVKGDSDLRGNAEIGKNLHVVGTSALDGDVMAGSDMTVKGDTFMEGNADIGENLHVRGTSQLDGNTTIGTEETPADLYVTGNTNIGKNLTVEGTLDVKDNTHLYKDLQVDGNTNIGGDIHIGGNEIVEGDSNVQGNQLIEKNLTVNGDSHFYGNGRVDKDFSVGGNSDFEGDVRIRKDLKVDGNATVSGTLTADRIMVGGFDVQKEFERTDNRIDSVGANAAALAGLHPPAYEDGQKWNVSAAYGNYKGESAGAVGLFYRPDNRVTFSVAGSFGNDDGMMNVGVSYALQKGVGTSKSALQQKVKEQDKKIADMERTIRDMANKLQSLSLITDKKASFPDVPSGHWANNAVETLHGNDMVQGYPDGTFKGERPMTRYEYAEMLFNALSQGANVKKEHVRKYAPELKQIAQKTGKSEVLAGYISPEEDLKMQVAGKLYNARH